MSFMHAIQITFFGAFKTAYTAGAITVEVPSQATVRDLKHIIMQKMRLDDAAAQRAGLVADSVLADDKHILSDEAEVTMYHRLALLPPVCGG